MTPSEKFVFDLCNRSFLPFWSFPNPLGKKKNELCDVLIVCGNAVIIISVKEIQISNSSDQTVQYERWIKKAISKSIDQIVGAEKFIQANDEILLKDEKTMIKLPPIESRKIFRIAVAFGSQQNFPLPTGDFGNGFVHVFDEESTFRVIDELDTITDFTNYLNAKEKFLIDKTLLTSKEVDFLTLYIQTQFQFENVPDSIVIDDTLWDNYIQSEEYFDWRRKIKPSKLWDNMIVQIFNYHVRDNNSDLNRHEIEEVLRIINLESRINRVELSIVLENAKKENVTARMLQPLPGTDHSYVFLFSKKTDPKEIRTELQMRCHVARTLNQNTKKVIGISFNKGWFDILYLDVPNLDNEFIELAEEIKNELGYFKNYKISQSSTFKN